jgi:protein SCO1
MAPQRRDPRERAPGKPDPGSPRRFILVTVLLAGFVVLAASGLLSLALHDSPRGAAGTVLASAIGGPLRLVDQDGQTVTDADLKGKWLLVYFGYTRCPDACPTALNDIAIALDDLGPQRDAFRPVFITVDPERDTPEVMKAYVESFDAPILALTGTPRKWPRRPRATVSTTTSIRNRAVTTRWITAR